MLQKLHSPIIPGCMTHSSKPSCSAHDWEKNVYSTITGARDISLEPSLDRSEPVHPEANDQTVVEKKRLLRSRTLRLSTLCQPAYIEHAIPPPCTPAFSTLFQDSSKEQEDSSCTPPLETSSSFQKMQDFRQTLHLPRLVPHLTLSFLDTPSFWLAVYFALNLSLTLYNKSVLIHFPFPYTLTALHALCGTIGTSILLRLQDPGLGGILLNATTPKASWSPFHKITPDLNAGELVVLFLFSMLYTINIVVSNASLQLVTVPVSFVIDIWVRGNMLRLLITFTVSSNCARLHALLHDRVFFYPSQ